MMDIKPMMTPVFTKLKKLRSSYSIPVDPTCYRWLIWFLMYLVNTRLDICFLENVLIQFEKDPKHHHCIVAKNILRYLHGTLHYCLQYTSNEIQLMGYKVKLGWQRDSQKKQNRWMLQPRIFHGLMDKKKVGHSFFEQC